MCMFTIPTQVSGTRIFARADGPGRQVLAYSMTIEASTDTAMVLPLPVPANTREDAVEFIDLSTYDDLFTQLERAFPSEVQTLSFGGPISGMAPQQARLVVHDVGDYEASFVPTVGDFARLDPRFRLPERVWSELPGYANDGFAVFKLKAPVAHAPAPAPAPRSWWARLTNRAEPPAPIAPPVPSPARARRIHPMAFSFPTRDAGALFFPTVHVHDGEVHREASFDHTLFCQLSPHVRAAVLSESAWSSAQQAQRAAGALPDTVPDLQHWQRSDRALMMTMDAHQARGVLDPFSIAFRRRIAGLMPNRDTWVRIAP